MKGRRLSKQDIDAERFYYRKQLVDRPELAEDWNRELRYLDELETKYKKG